MLTRRTSQPVRPSTAGLIALSALACCGAARAENAPTDIAIAVRDGRCEGFVRRVSFAGQTLWREAASFPTVLALAETAVASRLEVSCARSWAPVLDLPAGPLGGPLSLELLPAGTIHGKLSSTRALPKSLAVRVLRRLPLLPASASADSAPIRPLQGVCDLDGASFRCRLPTGKLDLALTAPGFAPVYLWNVDIERGVERRLPPIRLTAGASVAGWVVAAVAPTPSPSPVTIEIAPEATGWTSDPTSPRSKLRATRVEADDRGFFQLTGLEAGAFRLTARRADSARGERPIELRDGEELLLPQPLELDPPITLEAIVRPAEAGGRPLTCVLERVRPRASVIEPVARGRVALDGTCTATGLDRGRHTLRVVDDAGSTLHVTEVEVEPGMAPLAIALDLVEVEGRVTFGDDEPVQGQVVFGTLHRHPNVTAATDEDGRFAAVLPRDGEWPIEVVDQDSTHRAPAVDVARRDDGQPTRVDVRLPGSEIAGTVREKGAPVEGAIVLGERLQDGRHRVEVHARSRKDGTYRLRGVRPGGYLLRASTGTSASRWLPLDLAEDETKSGIDLSLSRQVEVALRVVGPRGPIGGAYVQAFPVIQGNLEPWVHRGVTEADGTLVWNDVDGQAEALDLLVLSAGYGTRLMRIPVTSGGGVPLEIGLSEARGSLVLGRVAADGQTLAAAGARLPLATVVSTFLATGLATEGAEGFALVDFAPDGYALCDPTGNSCRSGELLPGGSLVLAGPTREGKAP